MKKTPEDGARALLNRIEETAFFAHYSLLGDGNVRPYDWEKFATRLTGIEKDLWNFLLLGQSVTKAEAARFLGQPALDFLLRHKLCAVSGGKLALDGFCLVRYQGMTFFIKRGPLTWSFIGDEIKSLLAFVPRLASGRCLSLYTSGGVEVLPLARSQVQINFADMKAEQKNVLRANLELNALEEGGKAWEFSRNGSGSYDLIVSNPPYLFQPPGVRMHKYAAGGPDGLKCVRKFLEAASTELKPGGAAITTFAFYSVPDSKGMEERLRAVLNPYGLNYVVAVSSRLMMEPGVPMFNQLLAAVSTVPKPPELEGVARKLMDYAREKELTAVHLLKARFWKPGSGGPREQLITNYSDSYYGTWTI
ncbi:MAG TPA: hypothetical protein VFB72_13765 [Verrucomicrobiae bacterium]|nr:hypothetical protein [Verrucomicrobiae bacterium]